MLSPKDQDGAARRALRRLALIARLAVPAALAAVTLTALPEVALAAPDATAQRAIGLYVEGPGLDEARADLLAAVPEGLRVVPGKDVAAALRRAGQRVPLGGAATTAKLREKMLVPSTRKALADLSVDGVVYGVVQRIKGKRKLVLLYVDRTSGEEPLDEGVDLEASEADRRRAIADVLGPRLRALLPQEETKPTEKDSAPPPPPKEKEEEEAPAGERVRHAAGSSIFGVELGFEVGGRFFSYSDPISKGLRGYGVFGAPMVAVAAEVYPFATTRVPFLKDLGLQGSYARAFALQSAVQGGPPLTTRYQRIDGGLRGRIRFSGAEGPVLGISGGVRLLEFHVDEPPTLAGQIPNTAYLILRGGLDTRIPVGRAGILLGASWFQPLRSGEVYGRFTGASVLGVDATLGLAVRIAGGFEARLWAEYTRFFSDFDPVLGDAYVAGGALDQYLGLRLAAAYVE